MPPAFLLDKAIRQMEAQITSSLAGGDLVNSLVRRTTDITGNWRARAGVLVTGPIMAALDRQLGELKAQRALATSDAGLWARPRGDEWYAWGLRAATTTRLTPDEIHATGLRELGVEHRLAAQQTSFQHPAFEAAAQVLAALASFTPSEAGRHREAQGLDPLHAQTAQQIGPRQQAEGDQGRGRVARQADHRHAAKLPAGQRLAGFQRQLPEGQLTFGAQRFTLGSAPGGLVPPNERWAHELQLLEFEIDGHPAVNGTRDPALAHRDQPIVLYCRSGGRSALAAEALKRLGFAEPLSMAGGFNAWAAAGRPTEGA